MATPKRKRKGKIEEVPTDILVRSIRADLEQERQKRERAAAEQTKKKGNK